MLHPPDLPGFDCRALTTSDVGAVLGIVNASEVAVDGEAMTTADEIEGAWSRGRFVLDTMSVGVEDRGRLIAVGEVFDERAEVTVHPDLTGLGIGVGLARWTWDVARANRQTQVGQTVSDANVSARSLFVRLGYSRRWTSWALQIDLDHLGPEPPLPAGAILRPAVREDIPHLYRLIEDAFNEWPDRTPTSFDDWRALSVDHPSARLDLSLVACRDDRPVGVGIAFDYQDGNREAWIQQLAVAADQRGKGLARAVLAGMFHRFAGAGYRFAGLSTDSRTGALGLYEHVGMEVKRSYTRWNKRLSPVLGPDTVPRLPNP